MSSKAIPDIPVVGVQREAVPLQGQVGHRLPAWKLLQGGHQRQHCHGVDVLGSTLQLSLLHEALQRAFLEDRLLPVRVLHPVHSLRRPTAAADLPQAPPPVTLHQTSTVVNCSSCADAVLTCAWHPLDVVCILQERGQESGCMQRAAPAAPLPTRL